MYLELLHLLHEELNKPQIPRQLGHRTFCLCCPHVLQIVLMALSPFRVLNLQIHLPVYGKDGFQAGTIGNRFL
jgi:hypothetical protein